jgi:membrane protein
MYHFLPSCKVKILHALLGGLIAAILLEGCKFGFVNILSSMPSYQIVYGAFAVVPLFLIWVFVAWCVVLLGAEVVRAIPFIKKRWKGRKATQLDWSLMILKRLNQSAARCVSRDKLVSSLTLIDADEWELVLRVLVEHKWVKDDLDEFELIADLDLETVGDLSEILHGKQFEKIGVSYEQGDWFATLSPLLKELREHKNTTLGLPVSAVI